jgi:hypothetical protein
LNIDHGLDVDRRCDRDRLSGARVLAAAELFHPTERPQSTTMVSRRSVVNCWQVMDCDVMVTMREQDTPFQVLDHHRQHDPPPLGSTTLQLGGNLDQHGPSWAKRPSREVAPRASVHAEMTPAAKTDA